MFTKRCLKTVTYAAKVNSVMILCYNTICYDTHNIYV